MTATGADPDQGHRSNGSRIAVIDKAVRVLDELMKAPSGLTPTDLATALDINRSSAFRLLTSLEQAGLLFRDPLSGRYRLGVKFLQYGESVRAGTALIDLADPTLRKLSAQTRQSVSLAIREGFGARCLHRVAGPDVEVFAWKVGGWLPMYVGAAPQALLSVLSDEELERFLAQLGPKSRSDHPAPPPEEIRASVAATRDRGYSLNQGGLTTGVSSLGVIVNDNSDVTVCAISVAGLEHHYRGEALVRTADAVKQTAHELGALLS
jgi:DNA-binding IclR family transcriptional regulator